MRDFLFGLAVVLLVAATVFFTYRAGYKRGVLHRGTHYIVSEGQPLQYAMAHFKKGDRITVLAGTYSDRLGVSIVTRREVLDTLYTPHHITIRQCTIMAGDGIDMGEIPFPSRTTISDKTFVIDDKAWVEVKRWNPFVPPSLIAPVTPPDSAY